MPRFTFAVVGRDEADTLALPLALAFEAAGPDDEVVFVDSASTDDSAARARALGATVLPAPAGKGRAMACAWRHAERDYLCFLDADVLSVERNVAAELRALVCATGADLAIADFTEPGRRRAVTPAVYRPLRRALFGDLPGAEAASPLSGFRAVRADLPLRPLPPGYGAEVHLELEVALVGGRIERCAVGSFAGKLRGYRNVAEIASDVAAALLDAAVAHGRLGAAGRDEWEVWLAPILEHLREPPPEDEPATAYTDELLRLAGRPVPTSDLDQGSSGRPN